MSMYPIYYVPGYKSASTHLMVSQMDDGEKRLSYEATSRNGLVLYMVALFKLHQDEDKVNKGRFRNVDMTLRDHEVVQKFDTAKGILAGGPGYCEAVEQQIEWVSEETYKTPVTWGFTIEAVHGSYYEHHYFFSDADLAVHFKLYWS